MASGSLCFEAHFAWLRFRECSETPVDCNRMCAAFPSRGGVCPMTRQMDNIDSPGALACDIFLLKRLCQFFWADSMTPFSPHFLSFIVCHINTQERSPPLPPLNPLLLQPGTEKELLAFPHKPEPLIINSYANGWGGMIVEICTMVHSEHTSGKVLFVRNKFIFNTKPIL